MTSVVAIFLINAAYGFAASTMAKMKKGQKLKCVPCGREVIISNLGIAETTIWCCARPMKTKSKAASKKKARKK